MIKNANDGITKSQQINKNKQEHHEAKIRDDK